MKQLIRTVYTQNRLRSSKVELFMNGMNFPFYEQTTKIL